MFPSVLWNRIWSYEKWIQLQHSHSTVNYDLILSVQTNVAETQNEVRAVVLYKYTTVQPVKWAERKPAFPTALGFQLNR